MIMIMMVVIILAAGVGNVFVNYDRRFGRWWTRRFSENCTERQVLIVLAAAMIRIRHLWRCSLRLRFAAPTSSASTYNVMALLNWQLSKPNLYR